jgi:hypothetical protein
LQSDVHDGCDPLSPASFGGPASPGQGRTTLQLHTWPSHEVVLSICGSQSIWLTGDVVVVNMPQPVLTPELEPDPLDPPDDPELPLPEPEPPPDGPFVCPPHAPKIVRAISPHPAKTMPATRLMIAQSTREGRESRECHSH